MQTMKSKIRLLYAIAFAVAATLTSCKKIFDVDSQNVLNREQTYRNVYDADAAVLGIYGKFMQLAKQYIILNELRADLMSPTANADIYLQQLSNHTVTPDNPYIDPTPFYEVILNCNVTMKNFDIMLADKKLKVDEYNQRYSDVASIRCWVYLQLGIHFGNIPYVTEPLTKVSDLQNESLFPKISFQQLVGELIKTMEALPTKEYYPPSATLFTTIDGYTTNKFFINKYILLGELHLWNGAYDASSYRKAATAYKVVMATTDNRVYHIAYPIDVASGNNINVQYIRFRETDSTALYESNTEGWRSMFSRGQIAYDNPYNWEWIWVLPYNRNFQPQNPFVDLFSNRGGSYLVKPSQLAIKDWNNQVQLNNFPYDARGRFTYKMLDGQPVIMKFLFYSLNPTSFLPVLNTNGKSGEWFLYRAASMWQHFGEAANRDGRYKLAYAIANLGINITYDPTPGVTGRDVTNIQQTFDIPPYDFDARNGDNPQYRALYRDVAGLRGRANLKAVPVTNASDSLIQLENLLTSEGGRELAYEGQRWSDLLRIAIRRNDPSFLAKKIGDKLRSEGLSGAAAAAEAKLSTINGMYLPFKWQ